MTEDSPIYNTHILLITTDDGALFSCAPYTFRIQGRSEDCWRLIDTRGDIHKGPRYDCAASPSDVQRLVSAWWTKRLTPT